MEQDQNKPQQTENAEDKAFELVIKARINEGNIQSGMSHTGKPASSREIEALPINIAARALSFMYDAALTGSKREDTPTERAAFLISMQPAIMSAFMGITDSWQFRKTLDEHREIARKAEAQKAVEPKAPTDQKPA